MTYFERTYRAGAPFAVGVDLGGTKTAAGIVASDGSVLFSDEIPTLNRAGSEAILDATARLVLGLVNRLEGQAGPGAVCAVGVGAAGVIDVTSGVVVSSTDAIAGWVGTRITDGLSSRTRLDSVAINDVHAHALGEDWCGAASGASSVMLAAVGTGVGGSLVNNGRPLLGARSVAGHIGHMPSPYAAGIVCSCGRTGHVEAIASGPALHEHYLRLGGDPSALDARAVSTLASSSAAGGQIGTGTAETAAVDAVTIAAQATGQALGGLANVFDPEVIVVGGGLAGAGSVWWDPMFASARNELMDPLNEIPIIGAGLGNAAAIIGAARLAFDSAQTSERP